MLFRSPVPHSPFPIEIAVCRHGNLVAELVVSVVDGIRCATLGDNMSFWVVASRDGIRERVGDGSLPTEGVVAVGRRIAKRVDGRSDTAKVVVSRPRRVAASVGLRDFALERVVGECGCDARLRGRGADEAVGAKTIPKYHLSPRKKY